VIKQIEIFKHVSPPKKIKLESEIDFYGASRIIQKNPIFFKTHLKGFWLHGWQYIDQVPFIELYRWHKAPSNWPLLVHREDEKNQLVKLGDKNVHAVGAPILYCPEIKVEKLPKSLLIMPNHTLEKVELKNDEENYFKELDRVLGDFDTIAACLHPACIGKRRWVSELDSRGIPYIVGTEASDGNALIRMQQILKRFTHITTNALGSHVVYASLFGCCVSIFGSTPQLKKEYFVNDPYYNKFPHVLDWFLEIENSNYCSSRYSCLYCSPNEASEHVAWAKNQLGIQNMRPHSKIVELLIKDNLFNKFLKYLNRFIKY
jgi:hypothetical protein